MTGKRNDAINQTGLEIAIQNGNNHGKGLALPMRYCAPVVRDLSHKDRLSLDGEVSHVASKIDKMGVTGATELLTMLGLFFALGGGDAEHELHYRKFVSFYRSKKTGKMKADIDLRMVGFSNPEIYDESIDNG